MSEERSVIKQCPYHDRELRLRTPRWRAAGLVLGVVLGSGCEAFVGSGPAAPYTADADQPQDQAGGKAQQPSAARANGGSAAPSGNTKPNGGASSAGGAPAMSMGGSMAMPISLCDTAPQKALTTLMTYCAGCHSDPATAKAGFSTILNAPALLASGKVVKGEPQQSLIYKRISAGSMPPVDVKKRPGAADVSAIEAWISCGAADWNAAGPAGAGGAAFVSIDSRLRLVLDDLRSFDNPIDRERMRYIDLSNLSNAGLEDADVEVYRQGVAMLVNSLSHGQSVVAPTAVDKSKLIFRIDLRDYVWDSASWNELEAVYPYALIYNQDSRLFPVDEVTAEQIRAETNTQIPVIQGDWLLSHASRPPLYYSLLELPATLDGLAQQLGLNIEQNIATQQVLRAGFKDAGPSQNNRVIERHELGGNRGALWLSYDFSSNLGDKDVFAHPLDFRQDGGEMIFNLENGLQGYFIANAAGTRLDKAPNNVVQDPAARDGAVEAGLSCMNCHQTDGQLPKFDEIRDFELSAGANTQEIEGVLAIYGTQKTLQAAFDADQNRYRSARAALGAGKLSNTSMHQLDDRHLGVLDIDHVAAVVGLPTDDVKRAIDASPQAFPQEVVTLRTKGGGIQRDSFESIVDDLVAALGLGQQLRVDERGRRVGAQNGGGRDNNQAGAGASGGAAGSGAAGSGGSPERSGSGGSRSTRSR